MTTAKKDPKADPKPDENKGLFDYRVNEDGRVAGTRRKAGDIVQLSKYAAKYENVTRVASKAAPKK